jgi:PAS domain S-box-containing protein
MPAEKTKILRTFAMACALNSRSPQPPIDEIEILRSTICHLSDGVVVADRTGKFLICNQVARSVLASATKTGPPQAWSDVHGCCKPDGITPYPIEELPHARALAGETLSETELFMRCEQSAGIWISVQANPLKNEAGEILGSVVVFRDVTKRKDADQQIRTLTNAVEQTADSIIITDKSGSIEYVNPACESTTGYALNELRGLTPRIFKSGMHDDAFYKNLWATVLSGKVYRNTMTNRRKSGEIFFAEQTITPMFGSTGSITHFVTVIKDVTELRKLQEQQYQMSLARAVQQQFYKMPPPQIAGYDFAGAAFPADATGGDYFDFVPLSGGCLAIAVGDVCGHGIGSALLMAELRACLRAFATQNFDVGEILSRINNALVSDLEQDRYATLIFCRLHLATQTLLYASAGHTPGFILDSSGAIKRTLESINIPLGFVPDHAFECSDAISLAPGDVLALLTDGITDAERTDQTSFGVDRALDFIRAHRHESARDIVAGLYRAVRDFSNGMPQIDDITAVICKIIGSAPGDA